MNSKLNHPATLMRHLMVLHPFRTIVSLAALLLLVIINPVECQSEPDNAVEIARSYLGTDYQYGSNGDGGSSGFDCSGFVQHVYRQIGINLPRRSADQFRTGVAVSAPAPGDLVFFRIDGAEVSHVGIFTGDDEFIHSPSTGKSVRIDRLGSAYWKDRYAGARHYRK